MTYALPKRSLLFAFVLIVFIYFSSDSATAFTANEQVVIFTETTIWELIEGIFEFCISVLENAADILRQALELLEDIFRD